MRSSEMGRKRTFTAARRRHHPDSTGFRFVRNRNLSQSALKTSDGFAFGTSETLMDASASVHGKASPTVKIGLPRYLPTPTYVMVTEVYHTIQLL
jgi:hypothetical protein